MARDYKDEYKKFQSSDKSKRDRAARNRARRKAMRDGRVRKGDGKDLHHPNGVTNDKTVVMTASANRGVNEKSRRRGSKRRPFRQS